MISANSVKEHNPDANFYFFTNDVTSWQYAKLKEFGRVIEYDKELLSDFTKDLCGYKHVSIACFVRLLIPKYLPDLNRAIYLDCDTVCQGSLKDFYNTDFENNYIIGCQGIDVSKRQAKELGIDFYINSGVLLFNIPLMNENKYFDYKIFDALLSKEEIVKNKDIAITTCRAGNVIGGGDFANDRIIPDCIRAAIKEEDIIVRNPFSTRPYQHVLEPVMAYLMVAAKQYEDISLAGNYNVGPNDDGCYTTGNIVDLFCSSWNKMADSGNNSFNKASWENKAELNAPHEANFLKLDCAKIKSTFGWNPRWNLETAMEKIVEWSELYLCNKSDTINPLALDSSTGQPLVCSFTSLITNLYFAPGNSLSSGLASNLLTTPYVLPKFTWISLLFGSIFSTSA